MQCVPATLERRPAQRTSVGLRCNARARGAVRCGCCHRARCDARGMHRYLFETDGSCLLMPSALQARPRRRCSAGAGAGWRKRRLGAGAGAAGLGPPEMDALGTCRAPPPQAPPPPDGPGPAGLPPGWPSLTRMTLPIPTARPNAMMPLPLSAVAAPYPAMR